ncbi:hypothetical protein OH76DRAFT_1415535 [Lentinus brumalis]|uniref:DUF6533 domain-containing protein n=1 Tax=Lentinus brumalis TaxID=2498619 RepID=A0A371DNC9_9APHY|nr:hypothetical protein OH76DRAFT_1415535 [Polyporus brumalis]
MLSEAGANPAIVALFDKLVHITERLITLSDSYPAEYCKMATSAALDPLQAHRAKLTLLLAVALFIYESIVTFDREVAHFWTAKCTGASLLFFANKWFSIIFYVMLLGQFSYFPSDKVGNWSLSLRRYDTLSNTRECRVWPIGNWHHV